MEWQLLADFIICCLVAVLCGLIIGLERESKGKPAGVRTLVLICLGSSIFVVASRLIGNGIGDPGRVAAQVVSGVGFLGAGAILQKSEQGYVAGLTTAASIWVTSAIGLLVGAGHFLLGVVGVTLVVLALRLLHVLEGFLFYERIIEAKKIVFQPNYGKTRWQLLGFLEDNLIRPDEYVFAEDREGRPLLDFKYNSKNRNHRSFLAVASQMPEITEII